MCKRVWCVSALCVPLGMFCVLVSVELPVLRVDFHAVGVVVSGCEGWAFPCTVLGLDQARVCTLGLVDVFVVTGCVCGGGLC